MRALFLRGFLVAIIIIAALLTSASVKAEEGLNSNPFDDMGNMLPVDGVGHDGCPDGYHRYPSEYNDAGHDICAQDSESDGKDTVNPGYGGVYEPIGTMYVVNFDGDGVNCRISPPDGEVVTTLPHGYMVAVTAKTELVGGYSWQQVVFEDNTPNCFIRADFLSLLSPAPLQDPVVVSDPPGIDPSLDDGTSVDEPGEEPVDDNPTAIDSAVNNLPDSGSGDVIQQTSTNSVTGPNPSVTTLPDTGNGETATKNNDWNPLPFLLLYMAIPMMALAWRIWYLSCHSGNQNQL